MQINPPRLYDICMNVAVANCTSDCKFCSKEFRFLPNNVLFDYYCKMFAEKQLCRLVVEFCDLEVFSRLLFVKQKRRELLKLFQSLIHHSMYIPDRLFRNYSRYSEKEENNMVVINLGLKLSSFFIEGGWYPSSIEILNVIERICKEHESDLNYTKKLLDCYQQRIYPEAVHCKFKEAEKTFHSSQAVIDKLKESNAVPNLAHLYSNYSLMYFVRSDYNEAFLWSQRALEELSEKGPLRIVIDVLRQASRSCVVKRRFNQAGLLIRQAVNLAEVLYEKDRLPHFSDTLLDYGFYLLNYDSIKESVAVYEKALEIRIEVFEENNIQVALGHEDLAYALYVNEYSSGNFYLAREHAECSIRIMEKVLPKDHLMLASVKRVKALILEEIALDERNDLKRQSEYLATAENLHKAALSLSHRAFGEKNVQTAKHYGNLGRLYQSMRHYEEAEKMHLRAIAIKEELLGEDDYEVGLSIGHLASLYNYHMKRYKDAEQLYLRSIQINVNLFGEAYSGLEYDYRGLIHIYTKLSEDFNFMTFSRRMREWKKLRENIVPVQHKEDLVPVAEIVSKFFSMNQ